MAMKPSDYWEAKRRLKADLLALGDDQQDARGALPEVDLDHLLYLGPDGRFKRDYTGDDSSGTNTAPFFGRVARGLGRALLCFFGARR